MVVSNVPSVFLSLSQAPSAKVSSSRTGARACSEPTADRFVPSRRSSAGECLLRKQVQCLAHFGAGLAPNLCGQQRYPFTPSPHGLPLQLTECQIPQGRRHGQERQQNRLVDRCQRYATDKPVGRDCEDNTRRRGYPCHLNSSEPCISHHSLLVSCDTGAPRCLPRTGCLDHSTLPVLKRRGS